jgi:hypothetical protein
MKTLFSSYRARLVAPLLALASAQALVSVLPGAEPATNAPRIVLHFSDGSPDAVGLDAVNRRLREVGVRVSRVPVPQAARPLLDASHSRALTPDEASTVLRHFHLSRRDLLEEIRLAGRTPELPRGGHLQTSEAGVPPYPKVYDMKALTPAVAAYLQRKFGLLHVNSDDSGAGIDEVMTIVSGGPYTWFFTLGQDAVGKLNLGEVRPGDAAWRLSYPGLVPHGGFFDAPHGLVVAHAHGPRTFVMRYDEPDVEGAATLADNPWIDFSGAQPKLLSQPRPTTGNP